MAEVHSRTTGGHFLSRARNAVRGTVAGFSDVAGMVNAFQTHRAATVVYKGAAFLAESDTQVRLDSDAHALLRILQSVESNQDFLDATGTAKRRASCFAQRAKIRAPVRITFPIDPSVDHRPKRERSPQVEVGALRETWIPSHELIQHRDHIPVARSLPQIVSLSA
ncbi:hypothetical protein R1flu_020510 [Riccia fluitans]|uniref:Uncharacterized protein n=1 Tax=Riccia fluitans TaxID=41844 RepID=A0ABD1ZLQ6_9MARC